MEFIHSLYKCVCMPEIVMYFFPMNNVQNKITCPQGYIIRLARGYVMYQTKIILFTQTETYFEYFPSLFELQLWKVWCSPFIEISRAERRRRDDSRKKINLAREWQKVWFNRIEYEIWRGFCHVKCFYSRFILFNLAWLCTKRLQRGYISKRPGATHRDTLQQPCYYY